MNKTIIAMALCFTAVSTAYAAPEIDKDALLKCQTEATNDVRLACYDKVLPPNVADDVKASVGVGKWQVSTKVSPVDDSKNVYLTLNANEPVRSRFGESVTPEIFITCREKKTDLYIDWDTFIGSDETQMLYRLDKQKAKTKTWNISTDSKAVFYQGNVIEFIKTLAKADSMYVQITPYNESPINTLFDLKGLSEALKPLQKACAWK